MPSGNGHRNGMRYARLVDIGEPGQCWNWLGSINKITGYGKKQWFSETWLAHRWVWTMLCGKIPHGMTINHKCRNRKCVNPHHLELMTMVDNCRHGGGSKLTRNEVIQIRKIAPSRGDRKAIAEQYGVSPMTISDIRSGRSWKDI